MQHNAFSWGLIWYLHFVDFCLFFNFKKIKKAEQLCDVSLTRPTWERKEKKAEFKIRTKFIQNISCIKLSLTLWKLGHIRLVKVNSQFPVTQLHLETMLTKYFIIFQYFIISCLWTFSSYPSRFITSLWSFTQKKYFKALFSLSTRHRSRVRFSNQYGWLIDYQC